MDGTFKSEYYPCLLFAHTPVRIQKPNRNRIIGQTHADESATDGIKPYETVRKTVRRNFSFSVITKKSP